MKQLNRTVALLCTLFLLAAAPAALASEPSPSASQNEPSFVMDIWESFQAFFDNLAEVLPSDDEGPSTEPVDEELPASGEDDGGAEPGTERFPFPDPNG